MSFLERRSSEFREVRQATSNDPSTWLKVLVVEDDESHLIALTLGLEREGYAVSKVTDGRDAFEAVSTFHPDIILLDIMLPGMSGLDVCRQLRAAGITTPIIMVSSRNEELDIVVGIEVGADDYVAKPYRIRELVARMNAVLRRHTGTSTSTIELTANQERHIEVFQVGEVTLDTARHEVFVRGDKVDIPLREFQLLRELMEHAGRVVTREELIDNVWGFEYDGDPRIIATLVGRLRNKIESDPDNPSYIVTIRGVGYRFNDRH